MSVDDNVPPRTTPSEEKTLFSKGYKLLEIIGEGTYAKVFQAEYNGPTANYKLACKIIDTSKAPREFVIKFLPRELEILTRLNHPHVIHIHSIFQRKHKYYIFMRNGENGDLLNYLLKNSAVPENQARVWTRQIALALQYLHEMEIAHRDLKCENVLITANHNVKVTDFGFARFAMDSKGEAILSYTYCGSMSYAAPEILKGKPYYPKSADMWSLGVVLFVMLNKTMPFDDTRMKTLYEQQMNKKYKLRGRIGAILSMECKNLMSHLLEPDFKLRLTATNVVESEWIYMDPKLIPLTVIESNALKRAKARKILGDVPFDKAVTGTASHIQHKRTEENFFVGTTKPKDRSLYKGSKSELEILMKNGYQMGRKLNSGAYSEVYRVLFVDPKERKQPGQKSHKIVLAGKVIDVRNHDEDFRNRYLPRELQMVVKLKHPHLVHTHSVRRWNYKTYIFMRFMEKGDLLDYLNDYGAVSERQARYWARQLLVAVQYLHTLDICHRDIKCENILLTANNDIKLGDFGFARTCYDSYMDQVYSTSNCGTFSYAAPEIYGTRAYNPKPTDLWSIGVVLFMVVNHCFPFPSHNRLKVHDDQLNRRWRIPSKNVNKVSVQYKIALSHMLEPNPLKRGSVDDILEGDWIAMDKTLLVWSADEWTKLKEARQETTMRRLSMGRRGINTEHVHE